MCTRYGIAAHGRLPGNRPHSHGDRVRGDDRALTPLRRGPGPHARTQRLVLQPCEHPSRPARQGRRASTPTTTRRSLRASSPTRCPSAPTSPRDARRPQGLRRVLHLARGDGGLDRSRPGLVRVQADGCRRDQRLRSGRLRVRSPWPTFPGIEKADVFEPMPEELYTWPA